MIYKFYSKEDDSEKNFCINSNSLSLEEFKVKYKERFKFSPRLLYDDDIEVQRKVIDRLKADKTYGFINFD